MFLADGFTIQALNARRDRIPVNIEQFAGVVILGGPMAVYDGLPYLVDEQDLIREAIKNRIPLLGVCLGSQLIAQAAGGMVYKGRKKEIGWHYVSLTPAGSSDVFHGLDSRPLRVFQWHGDTYDVPPDAAVLANSELYPQAFRVGSAVGIQFHLEVDDALIERWTQEYSAEVKSEGLKIDDILPKPGDVTALTAKCAQVYSNFSKSIKESR